MAAAAAGWYPSPDGMHVERFWDGNQWTQHQRPTNARPDGVFAAAPTGPRITGGQPFPAVALPARPADSVPVHRGSNRWSVGLAMLIIAVVLALTSFAPWAQLTYPVADGDGGQLKVSAELSGFGAVTASVPGITDTAQRRFVEDQEADALEAEGPNVPGIAVLTVGAAMALVSWAYLNTRHHFRSALTVTVLAVLGLINGLWRLANVRGMFNDPAGWIAANYSPGFGLVTATVAACLLAGLGITALILERRSPLPAGTDIPPTP